MEYRIEFIPVEELTPYEQNVKKHDEKQVDLIAESIKQFGFRQNLVVDANNVVVVGHGRLLAAKKLGIDKVPCVRADDLTEEQIRALRIADNKITEKAEWDTDALGKELKAIADDINMTDFGFGDFELTILMGDFEPQPYDKEETKEYDDKSDDFLLKKRVIITYLDAEEEAVKQLLGLESIDKVVYEIEELTK